MTTLVSHVILFYSQVCNLIPAESTEQLIIVYQMGSLGVTLMIGLIVCIKLGSQHWRYPYFAMIVIAFSTFNSSLVPSIKGLCSSNPGEFELSGV